LIRHGASPRADHPHQRLVAARRKSNIRHRRAGDPAECRERGLRSSPIAMTVSTLAKATGDTVSGWTVMRIVAAGV
jgi:hypothetical protein